MPPPDPTPTASWAFEAIGTRWEIDTASPLEPSEQAAVTARIEAFDRAWSRFRDDSVVSAMARDAGTYRLPDEAGALLELYAELGRLTGGAVDPLVGGRLADLGYDATYSLGRGVAPVVGVRRSAPSGTVLAAEPLTSTVTIAEPVTLDVGAAGKGLLVDLVAAVLRETRSAFTLDASGDLLHAGPHPLRVALEHPGDPSLAIGVVELAPGSSLCASATNRRAWGDGLHHVLDARTGEPTRDVVATWVVSDVSCMQADGLATAYFFAGPDVLTGAGMPHEFVRVHADGRVEWSAGLTGQVFA